MTKTKKIITTTSEYDPKTGELLKTTVVETGDDNFVITTKEGEKLDLDNMPEINVPQMSSQPVEGTSDDKKGGINIADIVAALKRTSIVVDPDLNIRIVYKDTTEEVAEETLPDIELAIAAAHLELAQMYQELAKLHTDVEEG